MQLKNWLTPSAVSLELKADDQNEVFVELLSLLESTGYLNSRDIVLNDILRRRKQGNFVFSKGIYIPHTQTMGVTQLCAALGISRQKEVFLLIVWPENTYSNLKILGELISVVQQQDVVPALISARSSHEICRYLQQRFYSAEATILSAC